MEDVGWWMVTRIDGGSDGAWLGSCQPAIWGRMKHPSTLEVRSRLHHMDGFIQFCGSSTTMRVHEIGGVELAYYIPTYIQYYGNRTFHW